ncbi:hypothetical protein SeLEV6574_g07250 [Synchytrium endobioticum]|uniref:Chromo domain-containing protein n=1 Tax=Synchytrium endobioticum TaxID=286115 RepID=A0A507CIL6_9FUNG|nr:hypothetical protein SeLEV6574_g07250 [Synchytrium endobioticum]
MPTRIISDRGAQFKSKLWRALWNLIGCSPALSTSYHPQTDGNTERINQTMKGYLRSFCNFEQDNWASLLPQAQFSYNNSYHESIGMSPNMAVYGQGARLGNIIDDSTIPVKYDVPEASRIKARMALVQERLQHSLQQAQGHYKHFANLTRRQELEFSIGDEIMIDTKIISPVAFEIQLPSNMKIHNVFHIGLLKPYIRSSIPTVHFLSHHSFLTATKKDHIIDVRRRRNTYEYLINWKGFPESENSWEPRWSLNDDAMLRLWHEQHPSKISPFTDPHEPPNNDAVTPNNNTALFTPNPAHPPRRSRRLNPSMNSMEVVDEKKDTMDRDWDKHDLIW